MCEFVNVKGYVLLNDINNAYNTVARNFALGAAILFSEANNFQF